MVNKRDYPKIILPKSLLLILSKFAWQVLKTSAAWLQFHFRTISLTVGKLRTCLVILEVPSFWSFFTFVLLQVSSPLISFSIISRNWCSVRLKSIYPVIDRPMMIIENRVEIMKMTPLTDLASYLYTSPVINDFLLEFWFDWRTNRSDKILAVLWNISPNQTHLYKVNSFKE